MRKIKHIAFREFKTRVRKKAFLISTLMGPVFMLVMLIVPFYLSTNQTDETKVALVNFPFDLNKVEHLQFEYFSTDTPDTLINEFDFVYSYIQPKMQSEPIFHLYYKEADPLVEYYLLGAVKDKLFTTPQLLLKKVQLNTNYTESSVKLFYSYAAPILIYFFIFLYGIQIMKGITEEKTNRIMEVLLCTVKPFEMMLGKIMGIFLMALLQFALWASSISIIYKLFYSYFQLHRFESALQSTQVPGISEDFGASLHALVTTLSLANVMELGGVFILYFVGGYFLFGALFAIVGAASDPETDTQQFLFPITIPLLVSFMVLDVVIKNPQGNTAQILSNFPFTSPIVMPACYGTGHVSFIQLFVSFILLSAGFLFTTWVAARIYRIGVLASGAKVNYKTLIKWFFEKN